MKLEWLSKVDCEPITNLQRIIKSLPDRVRRFGNLTTCGLSTCNYYVFMIMKALIVQNYCTNQHWGQLTLDSICSHIVRSSPEAQVDICNVIEGDVPPPIDEYSLIILTGGTFNLIAEKPPAWVQRVINLVKHVAKQKNGQTKLVGFCWGHQAIHHAFGGQLGVLDGTRIGVERTRLTSAGQTWFDCPDLKLHKFHKRYVKVPASGFESLAEKHEMFKSASNRILTLQSHPELTPEISRSLVDGDDGSYIDNVRNDKKTELQPSTSQHDGQLVWDRIMQWVLGE